MTRTPFRRPVAAAIVSMTAAAMVALGPLTAAIANAVPAKPANSKVWRLVYRSPTQGVMTGIAATGRANAWAVGYRQEGPELQVVNQLFVVHWNGKAWHPVTVPGGDGFFATSVEATSARNVWIFGQNDFAPFNKAVFRYDGAHWHEMAAPSYVTPPGGAFSVGGEPLVLSASDVWMPTDFSSCTYASKAAPKCASIVWHWNGITWTSYTIAASIDSLAGVAPNDVLAVGVAWKKSQLEAGVTVAYRWNGRRWKPERVPGKPVYGFAGVGMDSARDVWIGAGTDKGTGSFAMHWNGRRWTTTPVSGIAGNDVVPDEHGGVWLGNFAHWTGRTWIDASWAAPITGIAGAMLVKIPGTRGSYWGSGGVMVRGRPRGDYPGVMLYGPMA
jgi:hypothetical protein